MIGDLECLDNKQHSCSLICESNTAIVYKIKKEEFQKVLGGEDGNKVMRREAQRLADSIHSEFIAKTLLVKDFNGNQINSNTDLKMMCGNLMKEMFWARPPSTIELFTIKKQI